MQERAEYRKRIVFGYDECGAEALTPQIANSKRHKVKMPDDHSGILLFLQEVSDFVSLVFSAAYLVCSVYHAYAVVKPYLHQQAFQAQPPTLSDI